MKSVYTFLSTIFMVALQINYTTGSLSTLKVIKENEGVKQIEKLDDGGNVMLAWEVDEVKGSITFEIEAETTGYVGFGISPQGSMEGADIFIAGVDPNGVPYSSDRHGSGFALPMVDVHSDWVLLEAKEIVGILNMTYLKFSRLLYTCDDQDYPITNGTNRLIWAMGHTDQIKYHMIGRRGTRSINLLGTPMPKLDLTGTLQWESTVEMVMPENETSYWCSLHRGPLLDKKHHIVAFEAVLPDAKALQHTHHFILYNCYLPANGFLDEAFNHSTVDTELGDHCYKPYDPNNLPFIGLDKLECMEYLYAWAKGGKMMVLPENVGFPIGEEANGKVRYYKLEIHYDNPDKLKDVKFKAGVKVYYTDKLRKHDAGHLIIGHEVNVAQLIPPNTKDFVTVGHCKPECTAKFPTTGLNVFNVLLHSHLSGRKMKLRHFRNGTELPFLSYDDHYDFDYQQNVPLATEVRILPRDQLTYECTADSTWKKGGVVLGGLSTSEEMCLAFVWYWPKQPIDECVSSYPIQKSFEDLGITNYTTNQGIGMPTFDINEPEALRGDFYESMSHKFAWTPENIAELQKTRRYGQHSSKCVTRKESIFGDCGMVGYPENYVPYNPKDICDRATTIKTGTGDPQGNSAYKNCTNFTIFLKFISLLFFSL